MGRVLFFCMLICATTIIAYQNTLHSPFVFDDHPNIRQNSAIQITNLSLDELSKVFSPLQPSKTRPVANVTFALNYYFGQYNLIGYHIVNIFIHVLNGLLVFFLFFKYLILKNQKKSVTYKLDPINLAAIGALLWVTNPIQINAVTYIVQRMTSLSVLFTLLAFICYLTARKIQQKPPELTAHFHCKVITLFLTGIFCWILALLSKELAAILPVLILFHEIYFIDCFSWQHIRKKILYYFIALSIPACIGSIYFSTTVFSIFPKMVEGYQYRNFTLIERLLTEPRVVFHYISLFFYPISSRFSFYYDFPISHSLFNPLTTLWALIGTILWLGVVIYSAKKHPLFSFGLLWVFVTLGIESTVLPLEIIHEHRFYFPSIGLVLCIVSLVRMIIEKAHRTFWIHTMYVFLTIMVAIEILGTYSRNLDWHDDITFHKVEAEKNPSSYRAHVDLALTYRNHGKTQLALKHLKKATEIAPNNINSVGNMYLFVASLPESLTHESAETWLEHLTYLVKTSQYQPNGTAILYAVAEKLYNDGFPQKSLVFLKPVNELFPHPTVSANIAVILMDNGKFQEALEQIKKVQQSGVKDKYLTYLYAVCLHNLGHNTEAKTALATLEREPTNDKKLQADIKKLLRTLELNEK